jgi:hypothetical protein
LLAKQVETSDVRKRKAGARSGRLADLFCPPDTNRSIAAFQLQLFAMADAKGRVLMGAIITIAIGQVRAGRAPLPQLIVGGGVFFSAV